MIPWSSLYKAIVSHRKPTDLILRQDHTYQLWPTLATLEFTKRRPAERSVQPAARRGVAEGLRQTAGAGVQSAGAVDNWLVMAVTRLCYFFHVYIYIYMCNCMCVCIYLSFYLSFYLSIYLSFFLSIYLSIYLSDYVYIYIYAYVCVCVLGIFGNVSSSQLTNSYFFQRGRYTTNQMKNGFHHGKRVTNLVEQASEMGWTLTDQYLKWFEGILKGFLQSRVEVRRRFLLKNYVNIFLLSKMVSWGIQWT